MCVSRYLFISVLTFLMIVENSRCSRIIRSSAESSSQAPPKSTSIDNEKDKVCGVRNRIDDHISDSEGNNYFRIGEFPWIVAILKASNTSTEGVQTLEYFCSGSLLSRNVILTAAHCLHTVDPSRLRIRAGVHNMNDNFTDYYRYQERTVEQIRMHGNYSNKLLRNDLALLSVNEPFNYEFHIGPICAPLDGFPFRSLAEGSYNPKQCILVGWGKTTLEIGGIPRVLKKQYVDLMPNSQCENELRTTRLKSTFNLHPSFICAKGETPDDVCKTADGGASLICALTSSHSHNEYVQVGVLSWDIGCFNVLPSVYASLKANTEWLNTEFNNLNGNRTISRKLA